MYMYIYIYIYTYIYKHISYPIIFYLSQILELPQPRRHDRQRAICSPLWCTRDGRVQESNASPLVDKPTMIHGVYLVYRHVCVCTYLPTYLPACLPAYLPAYLPTRLSI